MNNKNIKKLANYTIRGKLIDRSMRNFVLNKLSRKELMDYLRYLKIYADKEIVKIVSGEPVSASLKSVISAKFAQKTIEYEVDESMGAGIKAIINDTVLDLSMSEYIKTAIENLKENYGTS